MNNTMQNMVMSKEALLKEIKKNRDNHYATYKEAQENYRRLVIEEMETNLEAVLDGKEIKTRIDLPRPESHVKDYDTTIRMLEMTLSPEIEINVMDFEKFVMDNWVWKKDWISNTAVYSSLKE